MKFEIAKYGYDKGSEADIGHIQQLLGHACLDTTAIYTDVTILQLQAVHARCHPSGQIEQKA